MTVKSLEGKTATEYADDAFDYDGYGLGEDKAGILFLVDMGDRNWATSTHGYAITAFTDAGLSYIEESWYPTLVMVSTQKHLIVLQNSATVS